MTYPAYYVSLLNLINGKNVLDTTPPDSMTETEKDMMLLAYEQLRPLHPAQVAGLGRLMGFSLNELYAALTASHERYDALRRHGFLLHPKETLWVEALDKALPLFTTAIAMPWSKNGEWQPEELSENPGADETCVHAVLVASIQYGFLVLSIQEFNPQVQP